MASLRKFSESMLKYLSEPIKDKHAAFSPNFVNGKWRNPKFSLRRQADLRKMCLLNGVDPESIGLPPKVKKNALRQKPPKLHKEQRQYAEKKAKVEKALEDMPKKIMEWKENIRKEEEKTKSSLPF
ncbi:hypothetical protein BB559_007011 [Furculomyces boomerangus]|uniref:Large ribosomal subunit protein mL59 domain-containing protein n=2 Tax=Harpellales TaxID=61421 RepID=A0A2T9XZF7_9FUNG|nr:hypothetical protein BB559_007011 [Furculomyces boomerangus]PWA01237.1 hypothetical protein BB558_002688 [Smittium angustum]